MSTLAVSRVYKGRRILTAIRYRFTGQREEAALGLCGYKARFPRSAPGAKRRGYDPRLGRFVQADSIVAGAGRQPAGVGSLRLHAQQSSAIYRSEWA